MAQFWLQLDIGFRDTWLNGLKLLDKITFTLFSLLSLPIDVVCDFSFQEGAFDQKWEDDISVMRPSLRETLPTTAEGTMMKVCELVSPSAGNCNDISNLELDGKEFLAIQFGRLLEILREIVEWGILFWEVYNFDCWTRGRDMNEWPRLADSELQLVLRYVQSSCWYPFGLKVSCVSYLLGFSFFGLWFDGR